MMVTHIKLVDETGVNNQKKYLKRGKTYEFDTILGATLTQIRITNKMSKETLSGLINVTPEYLSAVEEGSLSLSVNEFLQLSSVFQFDPHELINLVGVAVNSRAN